MNRLYHPDYFRWTLEQIKETWALNQQGVPHKEIGAKYGIQANQVSCKIVWIKANMRILEATSVEEYSRGKYDGRSSNANKVIWTQELYDKLKRMLLVERISRPAAAERLGVSVNAINGAVHRAGMCKERNLTETKERQARKASEQQVGNDRRVAREQARAARDRIMAAKVAADLDEAMAMSLRPAKPIVVPKPIRVLGTASGYSRSNCTFITQDNPVLYCDAPTLLGKSYCEQHYQVCYVKPRFLGKSYA